MDKCCGQPYPKACKKNNRQGKAFLKTEKSREKKKKCGDNTPEGTLGERLHDGRIAAVFKIHEDHHQHACQRHDRNQPAGGRQLFADGRGNEDDGDAENHFEKNLYQ
jgi:hypothetical protein